MLIIHQSGVLWLCFSLKSLPHAGSVFRCQTGFNDILNVLHSSSETLSVSGHLQPTRAVPSLPASKTPSHQGVYSHIITETHLKQNKRQKHVIGSKYTWPLLVMQHESRVTWQPDLQELVWLQAAVSCCQERGMIECFQSSYSNLNMNPCLLNGHFISDIFLSCITSAFF